MEVAMGAMSALLPKLGELLSEEYNLQKSAKKDLRYLQRELQSMNAALSAVAEVPRDKLAVQNRIWASDVRELSHDIEDIVESFLVSVEVEGASMPPADAGGFKLLKAKVTKLFKIAKARREIATAVKDIKDQVTEVANRDERYRGRGGGVIPPAATSRTTIDPLLSVLYENQKIVGMDEPRDKIIEMLRGRDYVSKKQPKILSIVGFGGLGKTTLAKAVYDELHKEFDCAAFVAVSRNPDVKKVFKEILFGVDKDKYNSLNLSDLGERELIDHLRESLGTKRYASVAFILIHYYLFNIYSLRFKL
jgi:disease resistance protein RPM1